MAAPWLEKGGKNSRTKMPKERASKIARKAARAVWQGHTPQLPDCGCVMCLARRAKQK